MQKIIIFIIILICTLIIINTFINNYFIRKRKFTIQSTNYEYIDGLRINFTRKGTGEPILLIHGFISSLLIFESLIDALAENNSVFALDLIGFGFSDKDKSLDYSRKNMGKLAVEFMNKQNIDKFILLGYSMGGEIALNMAYYYPENIKKLILVSSLGYIKPPILFRLFELKSTISKLFLTISFRNYFTLKFSFKLLFYDKSQFDNNIFNRMYAIITHIPINTLYHFFLSDDTGNIGKKIKYITANTLILWGRNDILIPLKYGKRLNNDIKNSTLVIINDCGHIPFLEKEREFINIIRNYLSKSP